MNKLLLTGDSLRGGIWPGAVALCDNTITGVQSSPMGIVTRPFDALTLDLTRNHIKHSTTQTTTAF